MLAFLERPSSLSLSCDISMPRSYLTRYEFPCGILEAVEIFCLTVFFLDVYIKVSGTLQSRYMRPFNSSFLLVGRATWWAKSAC